MKSKSLLAYQGKSQLAVPDRKKEPVPEPATDWSGDTPTYRAEVACVAPQSMRDRLSFQDACVLGVSLENPNFDPARLEASKNWISKRFKRCSVLVGDSIHRITLQMKRGLDGFHASERSWQLGQEFIRRNGTIFQQNSLCQYRIVCCSELALASEYHAFYNELKVLFVTDNAFAFAVRRWASLFIQRQKVLANPLDPSGPTSSINLACRYLLEEMAIFSCLVDRGWPVFVYPGVLSILNEIAEGKHPQVPGPLKSLVSVELRLKKTQ